jgi:hypothetical protein
MDEAEAYLALERALHALLVATGESPDLTVAKFAIVTQVWDASIPADHSRYVGRYSQGMATHEAVGLLTLESTRLQQFVA